MNRYTLLTFISLLILVIALPVYGWYQPYLMGKAEYELRQQFVAEAAVLYIENCAICHGAAGEGIGATPALNTAAVQLMDYDVLYKTIARGRYDTAMAGWHVDEGGLFNDYQVEEMVAFLRYVDWPQVRDLAAAQGLIPPTLPVPEVSAELLTTVAELGREGEVWAAGLQLYANYCTICHGVNGEGSSMGVALNTEEVRALETAVLTRTISFGVTGTLMPAWNNTLTPDEIANLVSFLQNWDIITAGDVALTPPEPVQINLNNPEEVLALGERLFTTACATCHGEEGSGGIGPALNSQQILTQKSDTQIRDTILYGGTRPNSQMPAFGDRLTLVEIEALVQYIRAWEPTAPWVENPRGTGQGGGPPWLRATPDTGGAAAPGGATAPPTTSPKTGETGVGGPPWRTNTATP